MDGSFYYKDADGDGFGDHLFHPLVCSTPVGFVTDSQDCNDQNNSVYPTSLEICDGLDNNCDGQIDESLTCSHINYFVDANRSKFTFIKRRFQVIIFSWQ